MYINFMRLQVIIEVNDCALGLMGESQEEDRRLIADLVLQQMETRCGLMPQELMVSIRDLVPFVDQLAPTISPMSLSLSQLATTISPMPLSLSQLCPTRPNVDLPVLPHSSPTHPLQSLVRPPLLSVCQSFLKHCIIIFNRWNKITFCVYFSTCLKTLGSESGSRPGSAMSSVPSEGGGARSKEVIGGPFAFLIQHDVVLFYQAIFASFLTDWLFICQPAAKAKGKPETGTLRKEPKKEEPKREPPKKEEPRKRDVSPEEKISRRKRHDSDEGENHRILILCVLLFLCNLVPIFFGAISVPIA